jgi:hypothetical protein
MAPAFVSGFEHDVFISYATVDDAPGLGKLGRVSAFVELLSDGLARLLGRRDGFSVWMDRSKLDGVFQLTPGIEKPLKKSAILVALLSNGYVASPWCPWERKVFLETVRPAAGDCARVFVIELDKLEDGQRPEEFADYRAYRFWVQDRLERYPRLLGAHDPASDAEYGSLVDGLARDIASVLKELNRRSGAVPTRQPKRQRTVYLAEPTDDLEPTWRKVKSYLEQQSFAVVPTGYLPRHPEEFQQAVKENLADIEMFVQLLSPVTGRKVDDSDNAPTFVSLQYCLARDAGLPILQWRDVRLKDEDLAAIPDPSHRDLLEGPVVLAVQIEEFKQEVVKTLARLQEKKKKQQELVEKKQELLAGKSEQFVFVVADPKDGPAARSILDFLGGQGFGCELPLAFDDPNISSTDVIADFEDRTRMADGMVIVYGQTQSTWYRRKVDEVRKLRVQYRMPERPAVVGVYMVQPPPKSVNSMLPKMHVMRGAEDVDRSAFEPFLGRLRELAGSAADRSGGAVEATGGKQ